MFVGLNYLILLIAVVAAEKQIQLEDIERDNLLSERSANKQEVLKAEQPQYSRTPDLQSYEPSTQNARNKLNDDIVYAQSNTGIGREYPHLEQSATIQYMTPQQYENETSYIHPVHEEENTNTAGSRESLTNTVSLKATGAPSLYLSQQPSYVYVKAGSQHISQNEAITYGLPQHSSANVVQQQQKSAANDISYASLENHVQVDSSQQNEYIPIHQRNYHSRVPEFIPLLSQNPYIMLIKSSTHASAYAFPNVPIQYAPSTAMPSTTQSNAIPTISEYLARTIDGTAVLNAPESTAISAATIQYTLPSLRAQPNEFNLIEYNTRPTQTAHYYPYSFTSPIEMYGSLQAHKYPSSLLDSYIPSSTILAAQRQINGALTNHHPVYAPPNSFSSPLPRQSSLLYQQGSHQPGYNTIAYSTAQSYSKRSPKLLTEHPIKPNIVY